MRHGPKPARAFGHARAAKVVAKGFFVAKESRRKIAVVDVLVERLRQFRFAPPREPLKPGESVTINEAVTDVPKSAKVAEIGWKPE